MMINNMIELQLMKTVNPHFSIKLKKTICHRKLIMMLWLKQHLQQNQFIVV